MPSRVPEKVGFLSGEIEGLRARIGERANAVQRDKLEMLKDIRSDYQKSLAASKAREAEQKEAEHAVS